MGVEVSPNSHPHGSWGDAPSKVVVVGSTPTEVPGSDAGSAGAAIAALGGCMRVSTSSALSPTGTAWPGRSRLARAGAESISAGDGDPPRVRYSTAAATGGTGITMAEPMICRASSSSALPAAIPAKMSPQLTTSEAATAITMTAAAGPGACAVRCQLAANAARTRVRARNTSGSTSAHRTVSMAASENGMQPRVRLRVENRTVAPSAGTRAARTMRATTAASQMRGAHTRASNTASRCPSDTAAAAGSRVSVTVTDRHSCSCDERPTASAACIAKPMVANHPATIVRAGTAPHPVANITGSTALPVPCSTAAMTSAALGAAISRVPASTRVRAASTHTEKASMRGRMRRLVRTTVSSMRRTRGGVDAGMLVMFLTVRGRIRALACLRQSPERGWADAVFPCPTSVRAARG